MVKNLAHAVFFGPQEYQDINVKKSYFLQGIIHIIAFLNGTACNFSTGELLRSNIEFFWVKIGIQFSLTSTTYNEKTFASYMPSG